MPPASTTENTSVDQRVIPAQTETLLDTVGRLGRAGRAPEGALGPTLRSAGPVGGGHALRAKGRSVIARGGILQDSGYNEAWTRPARRRIPPDQSRSLLGRRP
jgi:hypothetical protein